jgi:hypothetical protein
MSQTFAKLKKAARGLLSSVAHLLRVSPEYRWMAVASVALVALTAALPAWRILPLSGEKPFIPLHYNVYVGVDAFGPWYDVFLLPALGALLLAVNMAFQAVLYERERVLSAFFVVATLLAELVLLVSMVLIVLLNV